MEHLGYPDTLVEKEKLLYREMTWKNEALTYILSKNDNILMEANQYIDPSREKNEEPKKYL